MITNTIRALVMLMALSFIPIEMIAQCGTTFTPKDRINRQSNSRNGNRSSYTFNVFIHIIRKNNGSLGMDYNDIASAVYDAAAYFEPANICFRISGHDFIDSTSYAEGYQDVLFTKLTSINAHTDAIDIYVLPLDSYTLTYYNGKVDPIPSSALVMIGDAIFNETILAHELGHCFGLYHTGGYPWVCNELVDGTNCQTCGDYICDTPAEPSVEIGPTESSNCIYTGTATDINGDVYQPDLTNMMSSQFYSKFTCRDHFSNEQNNVMCNTIDNSQVLLDALVPQIRYIQNDTFPIAITSPFINININDKTFAASEGIIANDFLVENDALLSLKAGEYIIISPDSHIKPGAYFHAFIEENACDIVTDGAELRATDNMVVQSADQPKLSDTNSELRLVDHQTQKNIEVQIKPNPFSSETEFQIQNINSTYLKLQILDIQGLIVDEYEKQVMTDKVSIRIQGGNLNPGYYFYRLLTDKAIYSGKMLKI